MGSIARATLPRRRPVRKLSSPCGLEVDDELETGRLLNRQIGWLLALVWGPRSQATYFHAFSASSTSFIPVSLFDLESRFFAPTHTCWRPARAGAVKVGRRSGLAARSVVCRPRLDSPEHGGTLVVVGIRGEFAVGARGTRAATLYPVGRGDPNHDARIASAAKLRGGGPIS
jgi:hypothetical protein